VADCPHPFDDVVYLGRGRWSCSRCGTLVEDFDPASLIDNDRPVTQKVRDHARKLAAELNDGSACDAD